MAQIQVVDTNRDVERECDSIEEAEATKADMVSLGANPSHIEIRNGENTPKSEREGTKNNEVVETRPVEPESKETEPAPVQSESKGLPDRDLQTDPIAWLQQGSDEFVTTIKGTPVITKKGFRVLQHKYDISTGSEVIVGPEENGHEFCRVKAYAEMPDGRRAEAHASASVDRGDDSYLLVSMADTRAKSRALSDVTGVGAIAVEEMVGVENDD